VQTGQREVVIPVGPSAERSAGWFGGGELPSELREGAVRRLGVLGLLTAITFVAVGISQNVRRQDLAERPLLLGVAAGLVVAFALTLFVRARRPRIDPRRYLAAGAVFQVGAALAIGLTDYYFPWSFEAPVRGWSGVAVWIIIFAVIVPSTPRRTLLVSSVAAAMDPLALAITVGLGNPVPPARLLPIMFGPTVLALITALVASRINFRMGKKIHDAQELGSYQLEQLLGKGGMGEVWRARHKLLARPAAIKLIRADALSAGAGDSAQSLALRFEREAQATAQLESAHTIAVYDFGVATDGSFYYVMELLDGMDLDVMVGRFGPLPPERVIFLLLQVCDSLAEAHQRGLVHRDIKPSNIFVCRRALAHDHVKVLDFGLVKPTQGWAAGAATLTVDGTIGGTPAYMAPEVIVGEKVIDGRVDLYALGCVAYWMLSGHLLFDAASPMKVIMAHASEEPARLSQRTQQPIPAALEEAVHACLAKNPAQRPQNATELARRLAGIDCGTRWDQERAAQWWQSHAPPAGVPQPSASLVPTVPPTVPPDR